MRLRDDWSAGRESPPSVVVGGLSRVCTDTLDFMLKKTSESIRGRVLADLDNNVATVRTGFNAGIIGVAAYVAQRFFNVSIDTTDPLILVAAPAVIAFGYRVSKFLSARFPKLANVLFGIGAAPVYEV